MISNIVHMHLVYVVSFDVGSIVLRGMDRCVEDICVEELFVLEGVVVKMLEIELHLKR